ESICGTLAVLMHSEVLSHIRYRGVTFVELLPIHAFVNDQHLLVKDLSNYWGYNSIGFFAPHPAYLATENMSELKERVAPLHDAGLEVSLDVADNHTAEGNQVGPTLSRRGTGSASYYRLMR